MNKDTKKQVIIAVSSVIIIVLFAVVFIVNQLKPVCKTQATEHVFSVVSGDSLNTVSKKLKDQHLVKSELITKWYGKLNGYQDVVEGNFEINDTMSVEEILSILNDSAAAISNEVQITFTEGMWAKEIAELIGNKTTVSQESLLTLWQDESYLKNLIKKYDFITEEILNEDLTVPLEGYLAPNTYNFFIENTPEAITETLLNQTNKIYQDNLEAVKKSQWSFHEILTLASITQFESGHAVDNPIIAGIWENRLKAGMKLESSVTVCYALYEYDDWNECEKRIDIQSPYNTYIHEGIPLGPIANPGEAAIIATLNPQDTKYLFFISDIEGDGAMHYAETFEEHQKNINKYLR